MSTKSEACGAGKHEECDRLIWLPGNKEPEWYYCGCSCGCDGIGQEDLV